MTRSVRQKSVNGHPKPSSPFLRACASCGAGFSEVDGGASERGLWYGERWYCSVECAERVR